MYAETLIKENENQLGFKGDIEIRGYDTNKKLTKKMAFNKKGLKIEGDFYSIYPCDVKITKEGSNIEASFKIDDP